MLLNDGSGEPPRLRVYLNLGSIADLRPDSIQPRLRDLARDERLVADGFEGMQLINDKARIRYLS
jgi:hypothetical protein